MGVVVEAPAVQITAMARPGSALEALERPLSRTRSAAPPKVNGWPGYTSGYGLDPNFSDEPLKGAGIVAMIEREFRSLRDIMRKQGETLTWEADSPYSIPRDFSDPLRPSWRFWADGGSDLECYGLHFYPQI